MKKSISQKDGPGNQKMEQVTEEFTGKNLTRFDGAGLIRRFFNRHGIKEAIEKWVNVEGPRESKYGVSVMFVSILYGVFLGYQRPGRWRFSQGTVS